MNAIKIEGMNMPKSCIECPLMMLMGFGERYCFVTDQQAEIDPFYGRPDHCPMEEIKETKEIKVTK